MSESFQKSQFIVKSAPQHPTPPSPSQHLPPLSTPSTPQPLVRNLGRRIPTFRVLYSWSPQIANWESIVFSVNSSGDCWKIETPLSLWSWYFIPSPLKYQPALSVPHHSCGHRWTNRLVLNQPHPNNRRYVPSLVDTSKLEMPNVNPYTTRKKHYGRPYQANTPTPWS